MKKYGRMEDDYDRMDDGRQIDLKSIKALVMILVVLVIGAVVLSNSFTIIPTGNTGVRITMGQIDNVVVPNGFNWKIPFVQKIEKVNNKQQDLVIESTISAETSERNEVFFSGVTITYAISPEKSSWIYAHVTDYKKNLISESLVGSALKGVSKTLTPIDVTSRTILEPLVKDAIQESVDEKYGEGVVIIYKVVVNNATFDNVYNEKIAQKQQAQIDYETQQTNNKKAIEQAQAEAEAQLAKANAEAEASIIAAKADAEVAKISADSAEYQGQKDAAIMSNLGEMLNRYPYLIQYYYVTGWNGQLPKVQLSDGNSLIFDMESYAQ